MCIAFESCSQDMHKTLLHATCMHAHASIHTHIYMQTFTYPNKLNTIYKDYSTSQALAFHHRYAPTLPIYCNSILYVSKTTASLLCPFIQKLTNDRLVVFTEQRTENSSFSHTTILQMVLITISRQWGCTWLHHIHYIFVINAMQLISIIQLFTLAATGHRCHVSTDCFLFFFFFFCALPSSCPQNLGSDTNNSYPSSQLTGSTWVLSTSPSCGSLLFFFFFSFFNFLAGCSTNVQHLQDSMKQQTCHPPT